MTTQETQNVQTYRIEMRWDFTGTEAEAKAEAHRVAGTQQGGEVSAIFDEEWNEVT
jgi:hypothetical protein